MTAMYTDDMRRAFKSLEHYRPKNFHLTIAVDEMFINVIMDSKWILGASDYDQRRSIEYVTRVARAFESLGAVVQIVREPLEPRQ